MERPAAKAKVIKMKVIILFTIYLLPWIISHFRSLRSGHHRAVTLLNILGFTGAGWLLALWLATGRRKP
jgi:hypothetical protein